MNTRQFFGTVIVAVETSLPMARARGKRTMQGCGAFLKTVILGALLCAFAAPGRAAITVTYSNGNPINTTVAYGGSWTYSVSWVGTGFSSSVNTLYFHKVSSDTSYSNYPTNGSFSFSISGVTSADDGSYYVSYASYYGNYGYSPTVYLHVAPAILSQPATTTCLSGAVTSMGISAGPSTATFQWIDAATGTVLATGTSFTAATSMDGKMVYCKISNNYGSVNSSSVLLHVGTTPSISSQPASVSTAAGQNATFNITASGTTPLTYAWYKGGVVIPSVNLSTLTVYSVTPTNAGTYSCVVSNAYGTVISANATLTVTTTTPVILVQPTNNYVAPGQTAYFNVTASGYSPLSYAWYKNGVSIPGANLNYYHILSTTNSDTGTYACSISNLYGVTNTANVVLNLGYSPVITNQPQSLTATQGQSASFSVGADGTSVNYQWLKNGVVIANATNSLFALTNIVFANQANYSARASNNWGSVTSVVAALTVQAPPSITVQPTNYSSSVGSNLQVTVTATGSPTLSYQWIKDGNVLMAATNSTYQLTFAQTNDAGMYFVIITNSFGSVSSSVATVAVAYAPPTIVQQPIGISTTVGSNFQLTVTASGSPTLSRQWMKDGGVLFGATNTNYQVSSVQMSDAGAYAVIITNNFGSVTSSFANVTVGYAPPVITRQPTNLVLMAGSNASLAVTATGSTLNYQWYKFSPLPTNVAAATALVINGFVLGITVTNSGAGYSVVPNIRINDTTGSGAAATAVLSNGMVTAISVTSAGSNYSGSAWVVIDPPATLLNDHTNSTLSLPAVTSNDAGAYFAVVSNPAASATSSNATLTVQTPVFILTQPQSQIVVPGANANFMVVAGGDTPLSYQWWVQPAAAAAAATALTWNGFVYGTTVTSGGYGYLATPNVSFVGGGGSGATGLAVVSNGMVTAIDVLATGSGYTNSPIIQIDPPPALVLNAQTNAICSLIAVSTNDAGNYLVIVTNAYGSVTSSQAPLAVIAGYAPTITSQPASQYVLAGGTPSFSVIATGTPTLSYQWQKNGSNLSAATLTTFAIPNATTNDTGGYTVMITNGFGSATSGIASLIVGLPPQMLNIGVNSGLGIRLQISGTPNFPYVLEVATNLTPPVTWLGAFTNNADDKGVWQFADTNAIAIPQRFYRATVP